MGKSLLSIIAENELNRISQKNLVTPTDDVQKSPYKEYANSFGAPASFDYSRDSNREAPNVNDIGDRTLLDLKELNVFPQEYYERVNVDLNDASVIDMPEIDEISEGIYFNNIVYNKYAVVDYLPYNAEFATGVEQEGSYGDYIAKVKQKLETRGFTLADIFNGDYQTDDSPIGVIGGQALNVALNTQFSTIFERETLGRVNNNAFSVLQTKSFLRPDYDITVPSQPVERALEFLAELQGFQSPVSYLPADVFGLERKAVRTDGKVTYIGSNLTFEERISLLLSFTGKGQQQHLLSLLKLNLYNPKIVGQDETLEANNYLDTEGTVINARDFIATLANTVITDLGTYEPYGVVSIHKLSQTTKMISDISHWSWINDIKDELSVGWTKNAPNDFNSKSLLFKTQEIVKTNSQAFLDLNDKEFKESINGDNQVISRGDSTTASGAYEDDDGTFIEAGEYFRVWTKKRGYNRLDRTLRHRNLDNGDIRSVLNDNGLINFAPTTRVASDGNGLQSDDVIKRYMFSLENLAWTDHMNDLPLCEQGVGDPVTGTRGRIMWFPPYNLKITETVNAKWNTTDFIGRGEPIYTYNNTERSANLSFSIIVDHPDIVNRLVGEKTEYWERYFKGDKLIQEDAIAKQTINKKLSQTEIDEIDKNRKRLQPIEKKKDEVVVSDKKKKKEEANIVKVKEDDGSIGEIALSVYFPNEFTKLPTSTLQGNLLDDNLTPRPDLFRANLKRNVGYEDGGYNDKFTVVTKDGYKIKTGNGLRYLKPNNNPENSTYTYLNNGKLKRSGAVCRSKTNAPQGYRDTNNGARNVDFYFNWEEIFTEIFAAPSVSKVKISIVGNASGAAPTRDSNQTLSEKRAASVKVWFNQFIKPSWKDIITDVEVVSKSDLEDKDKKAANPNGTTFCDDCDEADAGNCKDTRRVDIWVKIIEENEPEPEPIVPSTGTTTIEDAETDPNLTTDADEVATDPEDEVGTLPLDPNILKKLIYTECDFFKYLETYEPTTYQTISERISYFWQAYHSITPQGFNSRLTFLQQCMRQGDSVGRDGIENWKNLAFGRPPVCILRIGDFYHTRIIIESMSIDYNEEMNWDLNPEGIGVQPMYADITLSIKIIGGSSMTAPINRLQNAMSFNYYANTEMYDGRADSVVFVDQAGEGKDDTATFGTLKNGKIVDGIRLSSITNFSKADQQKRLATLREQSRITLPNSTTANAEDTGALGEVGSLLETKKRLGLALTGTEKIDVKTDEVTRKTFSTVPIGTITATEVTDSSIRALKDEDSELNKQALLFNEGKTDKEVMASYYAQWMQAEVTDPNNLDEQILQQNLDATLESNKEIYFDPLTGERVDYGTA